MSLEVTRQWNHAKRLGVEEVLGYSTGRIWNGASARLILMCRGPASSVPTNAVEGFTEACVLMLA